MHYQGQGRRSRLWACVRRPCSGIRSEMTIAGEEDATDVYRFSYIGRQTDYVPRFNAPLYFIQTGRSATWMKS